MWEREYFFNVDLAYLLRTIPPTIIAGDLIALSHRDIVREPNYSKTLHKEITNFILLGVWGTRNTRAVYIYYT